VLLRPTLRRFGRPKNGAWSPQVVIALAVTRDGLPVRSWVFPGQTADANTVARIKADLRDWNLGRALLVTDAGLNSHQNRLELAKAGGTYLLATRLGSQAEVKEEVLARPGRFKIIAENLQAKEVVVGEGERRRRYIVCYNPLEAQRQRLHREQVSGNWRQSWPNIRIKRPPPAGPSTCWPRAVIDGISRSRRRPTTLPSTARRPGKRLKLTANGS